MRRTASQILNNLEQRVARLEKSASQEETLKSLSSKIAKDLGKLSRSRVRAGEIEYALYEFFFDIDALFEHDDEDTPDDLDFKILGYRPLNLAGNHIVEIKCSIDRPSDVGFGFDYVHKMTFQVIYDRVEIEVKEA